MALTGQLPLLGVSACVFRGAELLLVERGKPPFAGLLSLPGGKVMFGERLEEAVRREVFEETALRPEAFRFVRLHEVISEDFHAVLAVFAARLEPKSGLEASPGDDTRALRWVPVDALSELQERGRLTEGLAAIARDVRDLAG